MGEYTAASFGMLIAKYRILKGWTQRELAEKSGLKKNFIGQVERGKINTNIEKVDLIAKSLEISLDDLLCYFLISSESFDALEKKNRLLNEIKFCDAKMLADYLDLIDGYVEAKKNNGL